MMYFLFLHNVGYGVMKSITNTLPIKILKLNLLGDDATFSVFQECQSSNL